MSMKIDEWKTIKKDLQCCMIGDCKNCTYYNSESTDCGECTSELTGEVYALVNELEQTFSDLMGEEK